MQRDTPSRQINRHTPSPIDAASLAHIIKSAHKEAQSSLSQASLQSLSRALIDCSLLEHDQYFQLHPCVIEGRAALVYQANSSNSKTVDRLKNITSAFRIHFKKDERIQQQDVACKNRRQLIATTLIFSLGAVSLVAAPSSLAATIVSISTQLSSKLTPVDALIAKEVIDAQGVHVIKLKHANAPSVKQVQAAYREQNNSTSVDEQSEEIIRQFLLSVYRPAPTDPAHIKSDLIDMAHYYARHPAAIKLIDALLGKNINLVYKADQWQTQAIGNRYGVNSTTISMDTRVGAKLFNQAGCDNNPACYLSPADALLHELLHAKSMLLDSQHFIALGSMESQLYPFQHEQEVIASENALYAEMTKHDGLLRPLRHDHSGDLVRVNCAACSPFQMLADNEDEQSGLRL